MVEQTLVGVARTSRVERLEDRRLLSATLGQFDPFYGVTQPISVGGNGNNQGTAASAILSLPDGSAVVAASQYPSNATLAKITFDGTLDTSFGVNGLVTLPVPTVGVVAEALQPDGHVAVLVSTRADGGTYDFAVFRVDAAGTIDANFGLRTIDFGFADTPSGMSALPDGRLLVYGYTYNGNRALAAMARLNVDGSLDTSFGTNGKSIFRFSSNDSAEFTDGVLLDNGQFVLTGFARLTTADPYSLLLARFNPDGTLDSSFATNGFQLLPYTQPFGNALARSPDGSLFVAAGYGPVSLLKFSANGILDTTFGQSGTTPVFAESNLAYDRDRVALQDDGSILVASSVNGAWKLSRVLPGGTLDTSFGTNGVASVFVGNYAKATNIALQPDGRALLGGGYSGPPQVIEDGFILARYQTEPLTNQVYINPTTGILNVFGTENADTLIISRTNGGDVSVNLNGTLFTLPASGFIRIDARLLGGDDSVTLSDTSADAINVNLDDGNDTVTLAAGSTAAAKLRILGQAGNDTLLGSIISGTANIIFDGGANSDQIALTGSASADSVSFDSTTVHAFGLSITPSTTEALNIDLLGGNDTIVASAGFTTPTTVAGGAGEDEFSLSGDTPVQNYAALVLDGGTDTDSLVWTGTSADEIVYLNGAGMLFFNHRNNISLSNLEVEQFNALGGNDYFSLTGSINASIGFDGGTGTTDEVAVQSTSSSEVIDLQGGVLTVSNLNVQIANTEIIAIAAVDGDDVFNVHAMPGVQQMILDGGPGSDTLNYYNPGVTLQFYGGLASGTSHQINVRSGTLALTSDPSVNSANPSFYVSPGAALTLRGSVFQMSSLSVDGTASFIANGKSVLRVRSLDIASTGKLDLANNNLIVDYTGSSPLSSLRGLLISGRNGGAFNGSSGITSSSVASLADSALGYTESSAALGATGGRFAGQSVDATALLISFTYLGDTNLDRKIDIVDLGNLSGNWHSTTANWSQGDFNYDGQVDIVDLGMLSGNWHKELPAAAPVAVTTPVTVSVPPKKGSASTPAPVSITPIVVVASPPAKSPAGSLAVVAPIASALLTSVYTA